MINTSELSSDELEQAMYAESMNTWNDAFQKLHSNYEACFEFMKNSHDSIETDISNGDHKVAMLKIHEMLRQIREYETFAIRLSNLIYVKPASLSE